MKKIIECLFIARSYSDELVFQGGYNYEMLDPWLNSNENRSSIDL